MILGNAIGVDDAGEVSHGGFNLTVELGALEGIVLELLLDEGLVVVFETIAAEGVAALV